MSIPATHLAEDAQDVQEEVGDVEVQAALIQTKSVKAGHSFFAFYLWELNHMAFIGTFSSWRGFLMAGTHCKVLVLKHLTIVLSILYEYSDAYSIRSTMDGSEMAAKM